MAKRKGSGARVVLILLGISSIVGVVAYWRFIVSDRHLRADIDRFGSVGKELSAERCVDATLSWASRCKAMKALCDATTPHMMSVCLAAKDRSDYCESLGQRFKDTRFGFEECKRRGATRRGKKKTCAMAYRAIASHCGRSARRSARR